MSEQESSTRVLEYHLKVKTLADRRESKLEERLIWCRTQKFALLASHGTSTLQNSASFESTLLHHNYFEQ